MNKNGLAFAVMALTAIPLSSCWWKKGVIVDELEIGQTVPIYGDPDGKDFIGTFSPEIHDDSFCLHFEMEREIEFTFLPKQVQRLSYDVVFPGSSMPDRFYGAYLSSLEKGYSLKDPEGVSHELFHGVFHDGIQLDLENPRVAFAKGTNEIQIPLLDESMELDSFEGAEIHYSYRYEPNTPYIFLGDVIYLDPVSVEKGHSKGIFYVGGRRFGEIPSFSA